MFSGAWSISHAWRKFDTLLSSHVTWIEFRERAVVDDESIFIFTSTIFLILDQFSWLSAVNSYSRYTYSWFLFDSNYAKWMWSLDVIVCLIFLCWGLTIRANRARTPSLLPSIHSFRYKWYLYTVACDRTLQSDILQIDLCFNQICKKSKKMRSSRCDGTWSIAVIAARYHNECNWWGMNEIDVIYIKVKEIIFDEWNGLNDLQLGIILMTNYSFKDKDMVM